MSGHGGFQCPKSDPMRHHPWKTPGTDGTARTARAALGDNTRQASTSNILILFYSKPTAKKPQKMGFCL